MVWQVIDQCSKEFIISAFKAEKFKTDTTVFRLHYKLGTWLVILYSMCYMYVQTENAISCLGSSAKGVTSDEGQKVVNDFCWVHGTYSMIGKDTKGLDIFPGVRSLTGKDDQVFYHSYYKWMYFYIVSMLIMLHIPRQTWRFIEAGRMKNLGSPLSFTNPAPQPDAEVEKKQNYLAEYLISHLGYNRKYAVGFIFCELMNVVVSSSLLYMWDLISNHKLSLYGWSSFKFLQIPAIQRTDDLAKVFPLLSKCTFNVHGAGGNIVPHDVICVLPLNVINERAAVFFWCYFMILVTAGVAQLVFRIMLIFSKRLRARVIISASPLTPLEDVQLIVGQCSYSDWFIVRQLSVGLDVVTFRKVLQNYVCKLRSKGDDTIQLA